MTTPEEAAAELLFKLAPLTFTRLACLRIVEAIRDLPRPPPEAGVILDRASWSKVCENGAAQLARIAELEAQLVVGVTDARRVAVEPEPRRAVYEGAEADRAFASAIAAAEARGERKGRIAGVRRALDHVKRMVDWELMADEIERLEKECKS